MKKIVISLVVLAVAMTTIQAQNPERKVDRTKREQGMMMQRQLNLSEEQKQEAKALNENYRMKMTELRKKDDILVKDWKNQMMELNKKHREDLKGLLNAEQKEQIEKIKTERKKIAEIDGNARMEKMKLKLDLNNEQTEKLTKQRSEMVEKMNAIKENNSMDMIKKREEMKLLMDKRKENMKSILSEEQLKKMQDFNKSMHRKRRVLS